MGRLRKPTGWVREKKLKLQRLDDGDIVPRTGYYYLPKNTRVVPRGKRGKRSRSR